MPSVIPGIVGGTTIGGNAAYGASLNATPPCPCRAFSDGVMFGKTPRGDGRVCTDGDEIAIWRFEVISLKGISVPYTSVVQVQGDVAQLHLDALDDLALGGSRDGVPAVREDLLRYSETSRLVRSGWPTREMPTSAQSSSPQRVSRLAPSPGSLGGPSCVRSSGLTRPL